MSWVLRRFESLLDSWLFYGTVALMVGIGFTIWSSFKHLPGPIIALVALASIWFVLEIFTTGQDVLARLRRPRTPDQWGRRIREWVDKGGVKIQTDRNPQGCYFRFNVEYEEGKAISISMPTDASPETILLMSGVKLSDNTVGRFNELPVPEQMKLSYAFQLDLVKFGVQVPYMTPTEVMLQHAIPCAGLDEFRFQQDFVFMMRAVVLAVTAYRKAFVEAGVLPKNAMTANHSPQSSPGTAAPPQSTAP
jgi:hypothetical protein